MIVVIWALLLEVNKLLYFKEQFLVISLCMWTVILATSTNPKFLLMSEYQFWHLIYSLVFSPFLFVWVILVIINKSIS